MDRSDHGDPSLSVVVVSTVDERPQLEALAQQDFPGEWEVVVVRPRSAPVVDERLVDRLPSVRTAESPEARQSAALALGAELAAGEVVAYCDGRDSASPGWVSAIAEAVRWCDLVGGPIVDVSPHGELRHGPGPPATDLPLAMGYLPYVPAANLAVRSCVLRDLGGWDRRYDVGADIALSWRAELSGRAVCFAPEAAIHRSARALEELTSAYRLARAEASLYRDFRGDGVDPPRLGSSAWRLFKSLVRIGVLVDRERRHRWVRNLAASAGRVRVALELRP